MWSPIKLDFSFYDFSMIYYDFSKIHRKQIKKIKFKTVAKPPLKNRPGGKIDGFGKFRE